MKLNVVLVRTEYSSNIGSAARAMANMGGDRLILIDTRCELDSKAKQMAAGAQFALQSATHYASWKDFFNTEGHGLRIAMTRRTGRKRKVFPFDEKACELASHELAQDNIYLIFGPEADGLDAEDLAYTNFSCHLPIEGEFSSLNLAQAVLLALYIGRQHFKSGRPRTAPETDAVQPFYFPDALIKEWLESMGFDVSARKASAYLTLRKLFLQNLPTEHELHVLESVLQQNIRKLKQLDNKD